MSCSLVRIGEAHLCNTWQKVSYCKSISKDINSKSWQHVTFCMRESFLRRDMIGTHYNVWVSKKLEK